ncbi:hypothetical protein GCM10011357_11960 [Lacimicrobium alkaliphilum]|uniref:Copper-binding protein MbnP-like domain-containing protein n=2 Tax=Lacimicrobium alkaliphilum TaxID=1526571 RepID=A0ABQ1R892_9ALTE|nr:hypothetical protein GCM10011357_11960 [Lacimicrobium alkaliphilum]
MLMVGWLASVLLLSGCSFFASSPPRLKVELRYDDKPVPCGTALGMSGGGWYLEHSKFYLSEFRDQNGAQLKLENSKWQTDNVVLVSIEQKDCWRGGEMPGNHQIRFSKEVDLGTIERLQFVLGVPMSPVSQNPLTQPSPLNLSSMFWSVQSGHKFARIELSSVSDTWAFHLGGVDCADNQSAAQPCYKANLLEFELTRPEGAANTLVFHIDRLLKGIELNKANSCTFQPGESETCEMVLNNLHESVIEWI